MLDPISYTITYSNRRTVSIAINADGTVSVRAPKFIKKTELDKIVEGKREWILKKQKLVVQNYEIAQRKRDFDFTTSQKMLYRGKEYPIELVYSKGLRFPIVSFAEDKFLVYYGVLESKKIREAFLIWYKKTAKEVFLKRVAYYQKIIQEPIGQIRIKDQKCCYGSCSAKRNLNFNWKCILAPPEILDYIVVHELCHLKQMNHSKEFWNLVERYYPDYKQARKWLKDNGMLLEI